MEWEDEGKGDMGKKESKVGLIVSYFGCQGVGDLRLGSRSEDDQSKGEEGEHLRRPCDKRPYDSRYTRRGGPLVR